MSPRRKWATHTDVSTRTILGLFHSSAPYPHQLLFGSPQFGESHTAFSRYECLKPKPDQRSLFLNASQSRCLSKQFIFYVQCRSHNSPLLICIIVCINMPQ